MQLIGVAPTDTSVLARTGEIYDNEGDKSQAFQYYYDVSGGKVWIADHSDTITIYITEWRILILEWLINENSFSFFLKSISVKQILANYWFFFVEDNL